MSEAGGMVRFVDRHGAEARTRFTRSGAGPCVVLVHGVGMQAEIWQPQIDALAAQFDVIAYDTLGHGGSSLPPADATLADYAAQLLALLDRLGVPKARIVGHSMGGLIALEFALSHPERTEAVVALNAVFSRTPEQKAAVLERVQSLEAGVDAVASEQAIARWFGEPVPEALQPHALKVRELLGTVDPAGYLRAYRLFATADEAHADRLATLAMPALFLTGEHDLNSTGAMSQAMAGRAPKGRAEILPGERHMMGFTSPAVVNARLAAFLADPAAAAIDPRALRRALGAFLTGVTVVATRQQDEAPRGFTANSFTSVSLDPPLISVCIARTAASFPVFSAAEHFSVNILAETQAELSSLFASKSPDKFTVARWRPGHTGSPLLEGVAAWFDCRRHQVIEAGDHIILIGEVLEFQDNPLHPLGYCRGAHVTFGLSLDKIAASGARTRVGAILEQDGAVVLVETGEGGLDLPYGAALGAGTDPASLTGRMRALGLEAELGFLFAVFEDGRRGPGAMSIYYRGTLRRPPARLGPVHLVRFEDIAWDSIADDATRSMLRRYVDEREKDIFGIYVGDAEQGVVHHLARTA